MTEMMRKAERSGEQKSSFAVTCSLLSQYIKDKGGIGDLGLGMAPTRPLHEIGASAKVKPPTTMSLMPGVDVSESADSKNQVSRSMELFPSADVRKSDKTQLTIFYGGSVLVFDNFPEEKARDLMQLASKGQNFGFVPPSVPAAIVTSVAAADHKGGSTFVTTSTNSNPAARPPPLPGTSYHCQTRKASLHRFLEKRKERINAKSPYGSMVKPEERQPWLGLGSQVLEPAMSSECGS